MKKSLKGQREFIVEFNNEDIGALRSDKTVDDNDLLRLAVYDQRVKWWWSGCTLEWYVEILEDKPGFLKDHDRVFYPF